MYHLRPLVLALVLLTIGLAQSTAAQRTPGAIPPPARDNLLPVPVPRLDDLETLVATQIRDAQQQTLAVISKNTSSRELADSYGSLARVYHAYELLDSAEPAYLNARRLAPGNSEWPHLLGVLFKQTGRLEEAAEALATARRLQPRDYAAAIHLGEVSMSLNRLVDAREQFQSVVEVFPAAARRGLGDVAMRERRFTEAIEHYRAVLDRVPKAAAIHYALAMAYRGVGQMDRAREQLEQRGLNDVYAADPVVDALQAIVRGERAWVMQGRRAYEAGQFQPAVEAFTKALEAAPSSVTARVNLASALVQLGRDADAIRHLQDALRVAPQEAGVAEMLIGALMRVGRHDEAIATFSRAEFYRPEDEGSVVALSILLADRARFRDAITVLSDAHQRFSARTATATTLARLLASAPDVSLRDGQRALEIAMRVNDTEPSATHGETIALALAELGRCDEARGWMTRSIAAAEQAKNPVEAARLRGELRKYEAANCRP